MIEKSMWRILCIQHTTKYAHTAYCYPIDLKTWVIKFTLKQSPDSHLHKELLALNEFPLVQTKNHERKTSLILGVSIKVIPVQSSKMAGIKIKVRYSVFYNQRRQEGDPKGKKTHISFVCLKPNI